MYHISKNYRLVITIISLTIHTIAYTADDDDSYSMAANAAQRTTETVSFVIRRLTTFSSGMVSTVKTLPQAVWRYRSAPSAASYPIEMQRLEKN